MLFAAGCASAEHAPASSAAAAAARHPAAPLRCEVTVTTRRPLKSTRVGVSVRTVANAQITVIAHYQGTSSERAVYAAADGRRTLRYRSNDYALGGRVAVSVRVSANGRAGSCATWFKVRSATAARARPASPKTSSPAPASPTPTPTPTPASRAWCTATASVYYAPDDENNVYVHSNQPHTDATASADGYSWSYYTNGSGYALIYLNGPPPGAEITVTVGGATCTTSD
jgi:hypothetical protein